MFRRFFTNLEPTAQFVFEHVDESYKEAPTLDTATSGTLLCNVCDWVMERQSLADHETAHCPRCKARVYTPRAPDNESLMAWSLAALLMLGFALHFEFLGLEARGIQQTITLFDTTTALLNTQNAFLAGLVGLTTVILPGLYLLSVFYVSISRELGGWLPDTNGVSRLLSWIRPWMLGDVFLVGVLVGLTKIVSLAQIELGLSFWVFGVYILMFLKVAIEFDPYPFRKQVEDEAQLSSTPEPGRPAYEQGVMGCAHCDRVFEPNTMNVCPWCGRWHPLSLIDRWQFTLSLLVAAAILYVPAQMYPIFEINRLTGSEPSTILGGVIELYQTGSWPIALILFVASVLIPLGKIIALGWLCFRHRLDWEDKTRYNVWLYWVTKRIGRWSMIDIYVVALLVALVQVGDLLAVHPGPAAISFATVVIVTVFAAMTFDPRWIWNPSLAGPRSPSS